MENFSRYKFNPDKTVTNIATGEPITLQALPDSGVKFYRLTNDEGQRKRVYVAGITFPEPEVGMTPAPAKKEKATRGKLDTTKAAAIRERLAGGSKVADLAKEYGVDKSAIYDIRSGRLYNDGSIVYTGKR